MYDMYWSLCVDSRQNGGSSKKTLHTCMYRFTFHGCRLDTIWGIQECIKCNDILPYDFLVVCAEREGNAVAYDHDYCACDPPPTIVDEA